MTTIDDCHYTAWEIGDELRLGSMVNFIRDTSLETGMKSATLKQRQVADNWGPHNMWFVTDQRGEWVGVADGDMEATFHITECHYV